MIDSKRFINIEIGHQKIFSFMDGQALAKKYIEPNMDDLVHGRAKIRFLVPASRPHPNSDGRNNLPADFYTGMVEPFLRELRDHHMPELKYTARRNRFSTVASDKVADPIKAFTQIMATNARTYDALETLFWERIQFGLIYEGGEIIMGAMDADREFYFSGKNEKDELNLFVWVYKLCKALEGSFTANLDIVKLWKYNDMDIGHL